jgi:hypothetical protein
MPTFKTLFRLFFFFFSERVSYFFTNSYWRGNEKLLVHDCSCFRFHVKAFDFYIYDNIFLFITTVNVHKKYQVFNKNKDFQQVACVTHLIYKYWIQFCNAQYTIRISILVLYTIRYFKDQTGLQILPRDRSRTGPHLNVNQRSKSGRTDDFILFLDRTGPAIE